MCFEPGRRCCGVREGLVALSANVVCQSPPGIVCCLLFSIFSVVEVDRGILIPLG